MISSLTQKVNFSMSSPTQPQTSKQKIKQPDADSTGISMLPPETIAQILAFLPAQDLYQAANVNSEWRGHVFREIISRTPFGQLTKEFLKQNLSGQQIKKIALSLAHQETLLALICSLQLLQKQDCPQELQMLPVYKYMDKLLDPENSPLVEIVKEQFQEDHSLLAEFSKNVVMYVRYHSLDALKQVMGKLLKLPGLYANDKYRELIAASRQVFDLYLPLILVTNGFKEEAKKEIELYRKDKSHALITYCKNDIEQLEKFWRVDLVKLVAKQLPLVMEHGDFLLELFEGKRERFIAEILEPGVMVLLKYNETQNVINFDNNPKLEELVKHPLVEKINIKNKDLCHKYECMFRNCQSLAAAVKVPNFSVLPQINEALNFQLDD